MASTSAGDERSALAVSAFEVDSTPVAVLPMRLGRSALYDLIVPSRDKSAPTLVLNPQSATLTVNTTSDVADGDTSSIAALIANPGPDGKISLREAITAANNTAGADQISFNIPASDPGCHDVTFTQGGTTFTQHICTINPATQLPRITDPMTIDGSTQPGFSDHNLPQIELNGAGTVGVPNASFATGLLVTAGSSSIIALTINRFTSSGIILGGANGGNIVRNVNSGTDVTGNSAAGNLAGLTILSSNNTIGGTTAGNSISANNKGPVVSLFNVQTTNGATRNLIQGNGIGIGITNGGNNTDVVLNGVSGNTIGGTAGTTPGSGCNGACNSISFNVGTGVIIQNNSSKLSSSNVVQGNFIRLNGNQGVNITGGSFSNTIGGTTANARNVISGSKANGIRFDGNGTNNNLVQGNFIGVDADGIFFDRLSGQPSNNTIGGTQAGAGNVIAHHRGNGRGVHVLADGSTGKKSHARPTQKKT
jgi:hypothetical protein